MTYSYSSNFKPFIEGLVQQKKSIGIKYEGTAEYYLHKFDSFCIEHFCKEYSLTQILVMKWAEKRPTEGTVALRIRLSIIRQLAKHMISQGFSDAYMLPERIGGKIVRRVPHFFTKKELRVFFFVADTLKPCRQMVARHFVLPVIYRVIYCCGLRSHEARLLRVEDVDLESKKLTIRASKGPKDRIVMLADDVLQLCQKYHDQVSRIFPNRIFFFPTTTTGHYSGQNIMRNFKKIWQRAGLESCNGTKPHVHDLRHNFALTNLNNWVKAGENFNAKLPYLSRYMGHVALASTDYYLHFVPEFFPVFKAKTRETFDSLIPEADYEEA